MSRRTIMVKEPHLNIFLLILGLYYQLTREEVDQAVESMLAKQRTMEDGTVIRFVLQFISGHYYHITHHLAERFLWVTDEAELLIVLESLDNAARNHHIQVLAWNIMSNHVHLIIRTTPESNVPTFMQAFLSGAVQRINGRRLRMAKKAHPKLRVEPPKIHFSHRKKCPGKYY